MLFLMISVISLYLFRRWIEGPLYTKTNRIDGKVVIVTGCNTGIGKETALEMAKRGGRVYMACMSYVACEPTRLEIIKLSNNPQVFNCHLDLASFKTVRKFVQNFEQHENHLDILINNAGIMTSKPVKTLEGYEPHLAVNHLGHFLLTNLLLDKLKAAPYGRIVVVTSAGYKLGKIDKNDINNTRATFGISGYFNSKLANVLFTRKLSEILKSSHVTVNCLHPGSVNTNILGFSGWTYKCMNVLGKLFARSPRGGAQTSIFLALDPDMQRLSGGYYDRMQLKSYAANALDDDLAEWLWQENEKMVGLKMRLNK